MTAKLHDDSFAFIRAATLTTTTTILDNTRSQFRVLHSLQTHTLLLLLLLHYYVADLLLCVHYNLVVDNNPDALPAAHDG